MPIYAYRCAACGHAKDVLRRISDPPLADCPACGQPRFEKQVTAAGFQLKGSGWYVTDFRNGQAVPATVNGAVEKPATDSTPTDTGSGASSAPAAAPAAATAAAPAPVAAAAPASTARPAAAPNPPRDGG